MRHPLASSLVLIVALLAGLAAEVSAAAAPIVLYTDAVSGPVSGGENGQGAYLSIFGRGFGTAPGLGTATTVRIGGVAVANYRYLGPSKVAARLGIEQLTVQVGVLGGAAMGTPLPITVTVDGQVSNADRTFTPNPGRILFVSQAGNDATAVPGDITKPWRNLQTPSRGGAYASMRAGDHVVIRGGDWSDLGFDDAWLRFRDPQQNGSVPTGASPSGWIHVTAYPGPVGGNAIEDVHYTTAAGTKGGIHGCNSAYYGTTGEYVSISGLRIEMDANATSDAAPFNEQFGKGPWRVVNNEGGPWPAAINSKGGGYSGHGQGTVVIGNEFHHMACTGAQENHGVYIDSGAKDVEIAYNWIHDISGGNLIQFYDNVGLAGNDYPNMPPGWLGFTGMLVHHNWLENSGKYGLNMAGGIVSGRIWDNVVIGATYAGLRIDTISQDMDMTFAFNTFYDNDRMASGSGNAQVLNSWGNYGPTGTIRIYDNILAAGPRTISGSTHYLNAGDSDAYLDFRRNLYWDAGHSWGVLARDASGIYANPSFVAAASGDLRPAAASPAIDSATQAVPFTVADDAGNLSRPYGPVSDLGAYEYRPIGGDTTPPTLSIVAASALSASGATITWTTNEAANGQVEYGVTIAYGSSSTLVSALTTAHSISVSSLIAGTTYHYRVKSSDAAGNLAVSADKTFTTTANTAPVATAQSVSTAEDTAKAITLAGTDANGDSLTFAIVASPAHGTLSGSGANRTYTPAANYAGADSFTFTVNDGMVTSAAATVSITVTAVNDPPVAIAQSVMMTQSTAKVITLTGTDVEGSALTYAIVASPTHGVLSGAGANRTYTPSAGYLGADSFTFTVSDGTAISAAQAVSITVVTNTAPTVSAATATPMPVTGKTTALTATATDNAGEAALKYTWSATGPAAVTFSPNGSNAAKASTATFSKAGSYTLAITAKDAGNLTGTRTLPVTVNATATALSLSPTSASVQPGRTVGYSALSVDQFSSSLATQPAVTWTVSGGGTIDASGLFTAGAAPAASSGGTVAVTYVVTATAGGRTGTALVTVSTASTATAGTGSCGSGGIAGLIAGFSLLMLSLRRRRIVVR